MSPRLKPLRDQTIVITGASSGIGLVTARMAARRGARVVAAARNEHALNDLVADVRAHGGQAICVVADVGKEEDVDRVAAEAVRAFGSFDTWVNNAGVSLYGHVADVPLDDWRRMFDTTYWGQVHGCRAAVRHFRDRGGPGAIINVGSAFGDRATPVQSTYASAKFAVHGLTDALRMELEHDRLPISVTLVHPGRIDTPYNEHSGNYTPMHPAHRGMVYAPEAVADAILFAAAHPKRDFFVGSQAKFLAVLGHLVPRLTDRVMGVVMYAAQQSRSRPAAAGAPSQALFEPGRMTGHARGTHEPRLRRGRSLYVQATKRPWLTAAALTATTAGLALAALSQTRSRRKPIPRLGRTLRRLATSA